MAPTRPRNFLPVDSSSRQRSIFPLPLCSSDPVEHGVRNSQRVSLTSRRRAIRRGQHVNEAHACVATLNKLNDGTWTNIGPHSPKVTLAQQQVLQHVDACVFSMGGPPADLSAKGAYEELRGSPSYDDVVPSTVVPLDLSLLSLPPVGHVAKPLEAMWGDDGGHNVKEFCIKHVLPKCEAEFNVTSRGPKKCYLDPSLRDQRKYATFLRKLYLCGIVEFSCECTEVVGVFTVRKKNGKQRLVIDARRSNLWFDSPEHVSLASGDSLSQLCLEHDEVMYVGQLDIENAFYNIELPVCLRQYFCLPIIDSALIRNILPPELRACEGRVWPRLRVVPMGWTHALYICQNIHEGVALEAGHGIETRIADKEPSPMIDKTRVVHLEYVDNFACFSTNKHLVDVSIGKIDSLLNGRGLPTHEISRGVSVTELLGWFVDGVVGRISPTTKRLWKIKLAIRLLLSLHTVSVKIVEKLVGHCTFVALIRRESLCCFNHVYTWMREHRNQVLRMPSHVGEEFDNFSNLLPLLFSDLRSKVSTEVHMCDASFQGGGVVSAHMPIDRVKYHCKYNERWRWKKGSEPGSMRAQWSHARDIGVGHGDDGPLEPNGTGAFEAEDPWLNSSVEPTCDHNVPPLSPSELELDWKVCLCQSWSRAESLPVLEGRALCWSVKRICRNTSNHGMRHLLLSDSISALCCLAKGRSSNFGMNRVCRIVAAHALACNIRLHYRWIPSEQNRADQPSRGIAVAGYLDGSKKVLDSVCAPRGGLDLRDTLPSEPCYISGSLGELGLGSSFVGGGPGGHPVLDHGRDDLVGRSARSAEAGSGQGSCKEEASHAKGGGLESSAGGVRKLRLWHALYGVGAGDGSLVGYPAPNAQCAKSECHDDGIFRPLVFRGRRIAPRGKDLGGSSMASSQPRQRVGEGAAYCSSVPERLAQVEPTKIAPPAPSSFCEGSGGDACCNAWRSFGPRHGPRIPFVSEARRCSDAVLGTAVPAQPQAQTRRGRRQRSPLVSEPPSKGMGASQQDGSVRRECVDSRRARVGVAQRHHEFVAVPHPRARPRQRPRARVVGWRPVHGFSARHSGGGSDDGNVEQGVCRSLPPIGRARIQRDPPLPPPPRRCQPRRRRKGTFVGRDPEKGRMAQFLFGGEVFQACSLECSDQRLVHRRCGRHGNPSEGSSPPAPSRLILNSLADRPPLGCLSFIAPKVFLEMFCGSGTLSKAVRNNGSHVLKWDIAHGKCYDLCDRANVSLIIGWITSGLIWGVHVSTPSYTYVKHDHDHVAIRTAFDPMGASSCTYSDKVAIKQANQLLKASVAVICCARRAMIPVTLENPASSLLFLTPPLLQLLRLPGVDDITVDSCMFGSPWRKPLRIIGFNVPLGPLAAFKCNSSLQGRCMRTGAFHVLLCGFGAYSGKVRTPLTYPRKFCVELARCYSNAFAFRRAMYVQSRL
jgi:hypothetical protein